MPFAIEFHIGAKVKVKNWKPRFQKDVNKYIVSCVKVDHNGILYHVRHEDSAVTTAYWENELERRC